MKFDTKRLLILLIVLAAVVIIMLTTLIILLSVHIAKDDAPSQPVPETTTGAVETIIPEATDSTKAPTVPEGTSNQEETTSPESTDAPEVPTQPEESEKPTQSTTPGATSNSNGTTKPQGGSSATAPTIPGSTGTNEDTTLKGPTSDVSIYQSKGSYETIRDPLSWEAINRFPVANYMSVEEARALAVDFFRYSKSAVWMPSGNYDYKASNANGSNATIEGGQKYGGLPYISLGTGNIYRLMDYMDPKTHVVDIASAGAVPSLFGDVPATAICWSLGRVVNSASFGWTNSMVPSNGFLRVGPYSYSQPTSWSAGYNTVTVLQENGHDTMYESYALLKRGDIIMYFTTAGHAVMVASDPVVVRAPDGRIDPNTSYLCVISQTHQRQEMTNSSGDHFTYNGIIDQKWTFKKLFDSNYIPITFKEFTGEDPIESSRTTCSHSGETITMEQLFKTNVTSNYSISDIYASIYNKNGIEVYKIATRANLIDKKSLKFASSGSNAVIWGSEDNIYADQAYTVKIYAQLSTGERPTLWEGPLAQ